MVKNVIIFGDKGAGVCGGECSEPQGVIIGKQQPGWAGRECGRVGRREATGGSKEECHTQKYLLGEQT